MVACRRTGAEPGEFTVAPRYPSAGEARGGHDWLVEFRVAPRDRDAFSRELDEALAALNTDYRTKRTLDVGMVAPRLHELPLGAFHRWMRANGKLGDQHKVPRVMNDRAIAAALRAYESSRVPQAVAGLGPRRPRRAYELRRRARRGAARALGLLGDGTGGRGTPDASSGPLSSPSCSLTQSDEIVTVA